MGRDNSSWSFANGNSENGKPPNSLACDENRNAQQGRLQLDNGTPHGNKPTTTATTAIANKNTKSFAVGMVVCITSRTLRTVVHKKVVTTTTLNWSEVPTVACTR